MGREDIDEEEILNQWSEGQWWKEVDLAFFSWVPRSQTRQYRGPAWSHSIATFNASCVTVGSEEGEEEGSLNKILNLRRKKSLEKTHTHTVWKHASSTMLVHMCLAQQGAQGQGGQPLSPPRPFLIIILKAQTG